MSKEFRELVRKAYALNKRAPVTRDQTAQARRMLAAGERDIDVARKLGICVSAVIQARKPSTGGG